VLRKGHDDWQGETGYVDQDLLARYLPRHRGSRQYFVCASSAMMDAVESALIALDVPTTHVHMEHFNLA
jgi:predicted ferric reductase